MLMIRLTGGLDESWCHAIDWSDRTLYPFEYANVSCTHFIACPKVCGVCDYHLKCASNSSHNNIFVGFCQ